MTQLLPAAGASAVLVLNNPLKTKCPDVILPFLRREQDFVKNQTQNE